MIASAGATVTVSLIGVASASVARGRCTPQGRTTLNSSDVTVWSAQGGQFYSCVRATGNVHRITHANASAKGFLAAGDSVSFVYTVGEENLRLDIFSALTGRTELNMALNDECAPHLHNGICTSLLSGFQLASNNWVAEYGPSPLMASEGGESTIEIDNGPGLSISHLHPVRADRIELSQGTGSTLAWTPDDGTTLYSTPLGPRLAALDSKALEKGTVHAATPLPTACGLFTAAEAQAVLGTGTQTSSSDSCTYTMAGTPRSTLTVTLQPNLTPAQALATKQTAYSQESSNLAEEPTPLEAPDYDKYLWRASWDSGEGGAGGAQSQVVQIYGDMALTVELATKPTNSASSEYQVGTSQCWESAAAVEHVTDIAFDRLMGMDISYRTGTEKRSCVKANESF
ncbi:MAG: hypothetical protein WBQ21_02155 [Solirubrobacteraceae bacterium]